MPITQEYPLNSLGLGSVRCITPKAARLELKFSVENPITIDFSLLASQTKFESAQTLFISTIGAGGAITITSDAGQVITVPAESNAFIPLLANASNPKLIFASAGAVDIRAHVLNFYVAPAIWGGAASTLIVVGNVADQDPDAGNPIKVGAIYSATLPTYTDLDRSNLHVSDRGELKVLAGGYMVTPSNPFTRPADVLVYASGDLVANSTIAASVVPFSWATAARLITGSFMIRRVRLTKSTTTNTLATFRLHLFNADPTATAPTGGDNAALSLTGALADWVGFVDLDMTTAPAIHTDGLSVIGVPANGTDINIKLPAGTTLYGLLEARAAYVPASAEVFTAYLEILQN